MYTNYRWFLIICSPSRACPGRQSSSEAACSPAAPGVTMSRGLLGGRDYTGQLLYSVADSTVIMSMDNH